MKRYFMIDYENVGDAGLSGFENLKKKDRIYLFYNAKQKLTLKISDYMILSKLNLIFVLRDCENSPNALDFIMIETLGEILAETKKKNSIEFVIVSKDKGFLSITSRVSRKQKISFVDSIDDYYKKEKSHVCDIEKIQDIKKNRKKKENNEFSNVYLRKMTHLSFGSNTNKVKEIILASKNENELKVELEKEFKKGANYFKNLKVAKG